MSDRIFKVVDLFCGIGGFSYGFEMTGRFEVVCAADIWKTAIDTYVLNHRNKDAEVLLQDLTTLDGSFWDKYKDTDVIIAGPPCQGFSMSGKRKVGDKRNSLFEEVIKITSIVNPKYVVIENVVGLLSMTDLDGKNVRCLIEEEFRRIGYSVEHKVLNAADYGVPQARRRVIFIASRDYSITFPAPVLSPDSYVTVGDALGNVDPDGDFYTEPVTEFQKLMKGRKDIQNHSKRLSNALVTERMSHIPEGGNWKDIPPELGTGGGVHSNAYRRLDSSKPSVTIKHAAKAMIIHPKRNRILTCREVARLQSFSDDFVITGTNSDQHQQLANAVPPLLGKAIAGELLRHLDEKQPSGFRFIDLFAGMGGFRLAFESCGGTCVFSSEIETHACETYRDNFGVMPSGDITKIRSEDIPDFDILCAGFPCQPFSIAGKRLGFSDTRGTLFFEVARILKEKRPRGFLLENVKGLTNHDGGRTIQVILSTLDEIGYVTVHKVLNAKEYGVPQNRERWYCLGVRKDLIEEGKTLRFPEKCSLEYDLRSIIKNVDDPAYSISEICRKNIEKFVGMSDKKFDEYSLAYEVRPSRCQLVTSYVSPCLAAKMGTGGNNIPIVISQNRKLTENECLRIMGYPEDYKIGRSYQCYKQIGNSVVVPVLEKLARSLTDYVVGNKHDIQKVLQKQNEEDCMSEHIIGDNHEGFANEQSLAFALNGKRYCELNTNLKAFVNDIFSQASGGEGVPADTVISSQVITDKKEKADLWISADSMPGKAYISVKKGTGNSVHQEDIGEFAEFLKDIGTSENAICDLKKFLYGDGTDDNTGSIDSRVSASVFKKNNADTVKMLNREFSRRAILEPSALRILFKGARDTNFTVDWIYHGTVKNGCWASRAAVMEYILTSEPPSCNAVYFGPMTVQIWNRNLSGDADKEYKRSDLQIKAEELMKKLGEIGQSGTDYS